MSHPDSIELERPEADAAEQAVSVLPDEYDDASPTADDEAPEWDAQEQRQIVHGDDEYR